MEDIDLEKVEVYLARRSAYYRQANRFKDMQRILCGLGCAIQTDDGGVVSLPVTLRRMKACTLSMVPQSGLGSPLR